MIPFRKGPLGRENISMQRVDGYYLYTVGSQIHPLVDFRYDLPGTPGTTMQEALLPLYVAEGALEPLITRSIFRLRTSVNAGNALLAAVRAAKAEAEGAQDKRQPLGFMHILQINTAATAFEAVLNAELALMPLYLVTQKAGYDTGILVEHGVWCFPEDVTTKVPDAVADLEQGTKCIAFDLHTAAGFHLHRANESVLRKYWDVVTKGEPRPEDRNIGTFLREMDTKSVGDPVVKGALRHLKDFHRNPLIHPEHVLENADQAIALMNGIHTVIVYMLKEIPGPAVALTAGALNLASSSAASLS